MLKYMLKCVLLFLNSRLELQYRTVLMPYLISSHEIRNSSILIIRKEGGVQLDEFVPITSYLLVLSLSLFLSQCLSVILSLFVSHDLSEYIYIFPSFPRSPSVHTHTPPIYICTSCYPADNCLGHPEELAQTSLLYTRLSNYGQFRIAAGCNDHFDEDP